jgi:hypothetical protein
MSAVKRTYNQFDESITVKSKKRRLYNTPTDELSYSLATDRFWDVNVLKLIMRQIEAVKYHEEGQRDEFIQLLEMGLELTECADSPCGLKKRFNKLTYRSSLMMEAGDLSWSVSVIAMSKKTKEMFRFLEKPSNNAFKYKDLSDDDLITRALQTNGLLLQVVNYQTPEMCMAAVLNDGNAIEFVDDQTEELCMAAVMNGGWLSGVHVQSEAVCIAAVTRCQYQMWMVDDQTESVCLAAVNANPGAIRFMRNPSQAVRDVVLSHKSYPYCDVSYPYKFKAFASTIYFHKSLLFPALFQLSQ